MAYNLCSGVDTVYKKLYTSVILEFDSYFSSMKILRRFTSPIILSLCELQIYKHIWLGFIIFCFQIPGNVEYHPKYIIYSKKQHLFLVVYEFSGVTNEVVLYWENTDLHTANSKGSTIKGLSSYLKRFIFCYSIQLLKNVILSASGFVSAIVHNVV